jgi:methylmalonyl-CoA mutase
MSNLNAEYKALANYKPTNKVRFITAASLFDGHDAAINIMRRILQSMGVEVIHLGHNRSVDEVVTAALQEDVQGIAISSYQGGHVEYFKYMVDLLKARGGERIKIFGGGGGVIVPSEIRELQEYGVTRIYSPEDGQRMGLQGMIGEMVMQCDFSLVGNASVLVRSHELDYLKSWRILPRLITEVESGQMADELIEGVRSQAKAIKTPVIGITGTGGSGKSSLTDELIRRLRIDSLDSINIAVISIDPSRRKSGGALLGDRIRMNAIKPWTSASANTVDVKPLQRVYMRSLATREFGSEISESLPDVISVCKIHNFDLIIVETSGIGQGDAAIVPHVDLPIYVMTPEYGAASQLEKIDMLDFADLVAINKFDRRGALDAYRDVAKQIQRNRELWNAKLDDMPVFGTMAARFNDDGVTALYQELYKRLLAMGFKSIEERALPEVHVRFSSNQMPIVPPARTRYLAEISNTVRQYKREAREQSKIARQVQQIEATSRMLAAAEGLESEALDTAIGNLLSNKQAQLNVTSKALLARWPQIQAAYAADDYIVKVRDKEIRTPLTYISLSGTVLRKVSLPKYTDHGELLQWLMLDNVPGEFPFTAGTFVLKRSSEDPTRMFAGEGDAFRTNRRFKLLSEGMPAKRLSTAFDSVTLYGHDPDLQPDIYGKVGNSGASIATLDDMKVLYHGFDLCDPSTSVSMTINGPAPTLLAMFMNTAIDQRLDKFFQEKNRVPDDEEATEIKNWVLANVRGTVQADILKEDQGQNTCIFSTEFSLKVMGDVAEYFVDHSVKNFYSVSISGYHIAEAGANPISQLAFTLSNGFTLVEAYLARGMHIDDFAPNLSFFFSNGMDPEYNVMGRVARRIWAVAMRDRYGANERSQKLKYHIQTSGRSLHAQEIQFNDIRTTLQALIAIYDNCNSLHTNAFDEAITTPTTDSVRRAMAIQLIINREWGLAKNENPTQGSFVIEELTELVEEAVLAEFDRIAERGGVLGAMETGYQRGKIQDESMKYEMLKHTGDLPIIGVNTFRNPNGDQVQETLELARSTEEEKASQLNRLTDFHVRHKDQAPKMLQRLKSAVIENRNVFEVLMDAVRVCSLGQITTALFEVGGQYRRNM